MWACNWCFCHIRFGWEDFDDMGAGYIRRQRSSGLSSTGSCSTIVFWGWFKDQEHGCGNVAKLGCTYCTFGTCQWVQGAAHFSWPLYACYCSLSNKHLRGSGSPESRWYLWEYPFGNRIPYKQEATPHKHHQQSTTQVAVIDYARACQCTQVMTAIILFTNQSHGLLYWFLQSGSTLTISTCVLQSTYLGSKIANGVDDST